MGEIRVKVKSPQNTYELESLNFGTCCEQVK